MAEWGCQWGNLPTTYLGLPTTYLGLPLAAGYKDKLMWTPLIDRFRQRLALWKHKYLTKGGQTVPIRSTLASLPMYSLSLSVVPDSIANELEQIMCSFLWGSSSEARRYHLLAWAKVCVSSIKVALALERSERLMRHYYASRYGNWEPEMLNFGSR